jgi:hypothetical protein
MWQLFDIYEKPIVNFLYFNNIEKMEFVYCQGFCQEKIVDNFEKYKCDHCEEYYCSEDCRAEHDQEMRIEELESEIAKLKDQKDTQQNIAGYYFKEAAALHLENAELKDQNTELKETVRLCQEDYENLQKSQIVE